MDKIKTYHLYPNLLSKAEIIKILIERQIKIPNIESKSYDDVLSIYNKFVLPLSRRKSNRMQVNQVSSSVSASGGHNNTLSEPTSISSNLNNGLEVTRKGHKRIQPPSETVECENKIQKLKLTVDVGPESCKRPVDEDNLMKSKRKKITW